MFLEIKVPAEPLPAQMTREGFLIVVCVHVEGEVIDLMERFVTYRALKLFLAGVSEFMVLVVAFLMEALAAELTHIRFVAEVDAHVRVESAASVECLATGLTLVRFL